MGMRCIRTNSTLETFCNNDGAKLYFYFVLFQSRVLFIATIRDKFLPPKKMTPGFVVFVGCCFFSFLLGRAGDVTVVDAVDHVVRGHTWKTIIQQFEFSTF